MKPIDSQTLELLRCPVTQSKLKPAEQSVVDWINQQVGTQDSMDGSGGSVISKVDSALVNENETFALPIRAGVISLSANRAISLKDFPGT